MLDAEGIIPFQVVRALRVLKQDLEIAEGVDGRTAGLGEDLRLAEPAQAAKHDGARSSHGFFPLSVSVLLK